MYVAHLLAEVSELRSCLRPTATQAPLEHLQDNGSEHKVRAAMPVPTADVWAGKLLTLSLQFQQQCSQRLTPSTEDTDAASGHLLAVYAVLNRATCHQPVHHHIPRLACSQAASVAEDPWGF